MTREELVEYIKSLNEEQNGKYGLIWDKEKEPEKIVTDCDKKIPVLKEIKAREIKNNGQENILIEGDNFHSLTILNYTHKEKVDIIYIDPPYNTGHKDFKYNDHFVDSEDGYRHSKWLNFMEKRLKLARNLLKDSGVIFISIDDNEHAQLKLLCDKIFDTNNCLGILPTIMNLKGNQDEFAFAGTHEYTLVYAKNKQSCEFGQFDVDEEEIEKDWEQDDIGYYKKGATLRATGTDADRVKRPYMFFASTNGSCLTEEMKNWFIIHKDRICLGLSLDGTPQMNYTNRGYYIPDDVLDFFVTTWPHQSVKMTISPNTISNIGDGIIFAHKKGFEVSVNLAYGINWDKKLVPIYEQELRKVLQFYLDNPNIKPCSIFDKTVKEIFYTTPLKRFCGAGKQLKAFDIDGNMYPCHVFGPNTLNISDWEKIKQLDLSHDEDLFIDKECTGCPIQRICPTCHGMNYLERGDVGKRDKRLCPFIKTEKKLLCLYLKETILQKDINELNETDYLELSAVKKLLSDL